MYASRRKMAYNARRSFAELTPASAYRDLVPTRGATLADRAVSHPMRRRSAKITNPMTPLGPVPFVGRQQELAELKQHLAVVSLVSLHGPLGAGKTRLVAELAPSLGAPCTVIECHLGDRASALRSRAERALRCVPGSLAQTLTHTARVLDDRRHPAPARRRGDQPPRAARCSARPRSAASSSSVAIRSPPRSARTIAEVELAGLDIDSASALWTNLEETLRRGRRLRQRVLAHPRRAARAAPRVRARPVRRERVGPRRARSPARAPRSRRSRSCARPVAPAAVSALDRRRRYRGRADRARRAPARRCGRRWPRRRPRGRARRRARADRSRAQAAGSRTPRPSWSRAPSAVSAGPRLAWQAGDDGAFGAMDQITRVREVVWHWIAAGESRSRGRRAARQSRARRPQRWRRRVRGAARRARRSAPRASAAATSPRPVRSRR